MLTREEAKNNGCPFKSRAIPLFERMICYHTIKPIIESHHCLAEKCPLWINSSKYPIGQQTCPYSNTCIDKTKCDTCIHRYGYCRG